MYELIYSPSALKQLEKLEHNIKERIVVALERLRIRPESCDIKKLVGMHGYRFRVGDYRIIFDMSETQSVSEHAQNRHGGFDMEKDKLIILVLQIGHRKNIYD